KQIKKWLNEKEPNRTLEYKIKSADGRILEMLLQATYTRDEDGKPLGGMVVGHDITERKEAARNLQIQEERLRLAQKAGKVGVFDWNMKTKKVIWSEELEDMFGLPPGGFAGTYEGWTKFVMPEDLERLELFLEKWLQSDRDEEQWEFRMRRADNNEVRWIAARARVFRNRQGKPERMIGTNIDFTDTKNTETEMQRLNETLEQRVRERTSEVEQQADQLRALAARLSQTEQHERRRLAQILHDHIQQLIAAARMQMGWLIQDYETEQQKEKAEEADNILKEAMEASRSLAIDLSPPVLFEAGLIAALNWLADRVKVKNDFSVEIIADSKAEPANDEMRSFLFECVRELLFNALKHSGVNEAKVELIRTRDNLIKLTVSDEGQGFDPEEFNKRMTSSNAFGLFSIKQRLSYWGGQMKLWSLKGDGTRVTLTVPGQEKDTGAPDDAAEKSREQDETMRISDKSDSCRVLIVDDHKIMREGLVGIFRFEPDIEVVGEATDGPQAIELAEKLQPDVIVMDINLGEMSGVEATKKILKDHPEIKVIGLSMNLDKEVVKAMRNAGACAYLTKDHLSRDLISTIQGCFEE
ncbi:response regulator, partial [candidate division KSB1 bacterium]|nr:response regulator [candidate division KSB1 bacterium]